MLSDSANIRHGSCNFLTPVANHGKIVKVEERSPYPPFLFPLFLPSPFLYFLSFPENQPVNSPSGIRGEAPAVNEFWCILSMKIAPGGNNFG